MSDPGAKTRRVWHVTPKTAATRILRGGLQPRIGPRSKAAGETVPAVFCFPSRDACEDALGSWLADVFEDVADGGLLIFEIDLPRELPTRSHTGYEIEVHASIPPACIRTVWNENWTRSIRHSAMLNSHSINPNFIINLH